MSGASIYRFIYKCGINFSRILVGNFPLFIDSICLQGLKYFRETRWNLNEYYLFIGVIVDTRKIFQK